MLDEKRIKEAQENVRSYLNEGLLRNVKTDPIVMRILIKNSKESLKVAEVLFKDNHSDMWAIRSSLYPTTLVVGLWEDMISNMPFIHTD